MKLVHADGENKNGKKVFSLCLCSIVCKYKTTHLSKCMASGSAGLFLVHAGASSL